MSEKHDASGTDPAITRKRKHEEMESDIRETQIVKIARTEEISSSSPLVSEVTLPLSPSCPPGCNHLHKHPLFAISMTAMKNIRAHLADLTAKNRTIKATMQEMREGVVNELLSHMRVRQLAIGQIGRPDLEDDMRELCLGVLEKRKNFMCEKEKELVDLEKLLGGHDAMLQLANDACVELDQTIESRMASLELGGDWASLRTALPHMTRLAKYTSAREGKPSSSTEKIFAGSPTETQTKEPPLVEGGFVKFLNFPFEIRLQIWRSALPRPRILTHHSHHNRLLSILGVCQESRSLAESNYTRILSPTSIFPQTPTPILFVNTTMDTVVRDLTIRDAGSRSLFNLNTSEFITSCHQMLSGLSQVKHLALAYDILRENGGTLFRSVQVCCPKLESLTVFPNAQLISSTRQSNQSLKFIELDSNLTDYLNFQWDNLSDRKAKQKALRGLAVIATLFSHSLQYKRVFEEYINSYGQEWKPVIKICLLARWNRHLRGWQARSLARLGDRCHRGFQGEDGRVYKGFVEAGRLCDEDGEVLSRYDGIGLLLGEG